MMLDERMLRLIAVGASISANCEPCLQANVAQARDSGASELEIAEAIWVGTLVRRAAASKMDKLAAGMNRTVPLSASLPKGTCECVSETRTTNNHEGD